MKIEESGEGGRRVRFSVKDDGAGISAENMKKLFGQYVQFNAAQLQKGKGSGLGLWITKSIVELHGGRIGANSNGEGHGTEFFVDIPLRPVAKTRKSSFSLRAFSRSASVVPRTSRLQTTKKFVSSETLPGNNRFKSEVVSSLFTVGLSLLQQFGNRGGSILTEDFGSFLNYPVRLHNSVKLGFSSNIGLLNNGTDCHSNINGPAAVDDIESARIDSKAREEREPYNPQKSKIDFDFRIKPQNDSENEIYGKTSTSLNKVLPREKWREGLKILLVDDALANRRICKRILTTEGHSVKDAVDGIDCLRVYEEAISLGNSFDLILLDDNMPNLLGYETAKRLRDQGYEGIIIGVTGDIYEENIQRFIKNGANDVMPKPLNMEKLEEKFNLLS